MYPRLPVLPQPVVPRHCSTAHSPPRWVWYPDVGKGLRAVPKAAPIVALSKAPALRLDPPGRPGRPYDFRSHVMCMCRSGSQPTKAT